MASPPSRRSAASRWRAWRAGRRSSSACSGRRVSPAAVLLGAAGTVCVLIHSRSGLGAQWTGLSWVGAVWLGVYVSHAARGARLHRVLIATIAGFVAALAVKGAHQLLI